MRGDGSHSHFVIGPRGEDEHSLPHTPLRFWIDGGDFCPCFSCGRGPSSNPRWKRGFSLCSYLLAGSLPPPPSAGLWYYLQGQDRPCLTLIGSPNFGYRSVHRDLEAQIAIVTGNEELQGRLQEVSWVAEPMAGGWGGVLLPAADAPACRTVCLSGAADFVPAVQRGVRRHVRAAGPPRQAVGETGHSAHQELLLKDATR